MTVAMQPPRQDARPVTLLSIVILMTSACLQGCGGGSGSTPTPSPSPSSGGGDYPGHGISKSTYSCNDPVAAWNWLNKYFPVETPTDECEGNVCTCPASGSTPAWEIQQGRVYAKRAGATGPGGHAGNGFGLHCVNVSQHLTTGGMSTAEVEAQFNSKLGDMSKFDAFMDYNVVFSTSGLDAYRTSFDRDGVKYLQGKWTDLDGTQYTSVIVQVPSTMMILELVQKGANSLRDDTVVPLEQRVPTSRLSHQVDGTDASTGAIITPLVVNRAASAAAMKKLEKFYVQGMGATMSHNEDAQGVVKKCFLWSGATVDVCYTQRDDSATKGNWKVGDFENMLNSVHNTMMYGHPFCGMDKWEDNHYAIDSQTADTSKIVEYINNEKPYHLCQTQSGGPPGLSGPPSKVSTTVHYVWDPTGWGIQLDLRFSSVPDDCKANAAAAGRRLQAHTNPACVLEPEKCGSEQSSSLLV